MSDEHFTPPWNADNRVDRTEDVRCSGCFKLFIQTMRQITMPSHIRQMVIQIHKKKEKINPREKLGNEYSSSSFGEVKIWNVESSLNSKTAEENCNHKDPIPIARTFSLC